MWPGIATSVYSALRRKGVDEHDATDAVQEAAARALARLSRGATFDSERGALRWCHRVASNHVTDGWRMRSRHSHPGAVREQEDLVSVDDVVEWRLLLAEVVAALDTLGEPGRAAVIAYLSSESFSDKRTRDRESLRRLRARERLRKMIGGLPVVFPWRRVRWWVGVGERSSIGFAAGSLIIATVLLTAVPHFEIRPATTPVEMDAGGVDGAVHSTPAPSAPAVDPQRPAGVQAVPTSTTVTAPSEEKPPAVVVVPGPMGGNIEAGTTANAPDRSLACVETELVPMLCVSKPERRPWPGRG